MTHLIVIMINMAVIPFNKPHLTGKETLYISRVIQRGHLSGNGEYTKACQRFFEDRYGYKKCLLTTSGTDALEMCAMLCNLDPGDEVIIPSYTFVSTALAFLRVGAKVVFADSMKRNPNLDADTLEMLITPRTRVIVPVHYAGVACDMDTIIAVAEHHNLIVVEDAAQAIDGFYLRHFRKAGQNKQEKVPLGSIGHLAAFSFHETKNITAGGEGGLLVVNDERIINRAEIIWEKGTNRADFYRGVINKYGWVDIGSSFLPSEINAAFLLAQLEELDSIQANRLTLWDRYYNLLYPLVKNGFVTVPDIPEYASKNGHIFYLICRSLQERTALIRFLKDNRIQATFHFLSLHSSTYYKDKHDGRQLLESDRYSDTLIRLPLFCDLTLTEVDLICATIVNFFHND